MDLVGCNQAIFNGNGDAAIIEGTKIYAEQVCPLCRNICTWGNHFIESIWTGSHLTYKIYCRDDKAAFGIPKSLIVGDNATATEASSHGQR